MARFTGRRAVVTGASRGVGAAIADRLAAEGADVVLVARTLDARPTGSGSLTDVATRLHHYGGIVGIVVADLTDPDDRARVIPEAAETLGGPIDILVNAATTALPEPVVDISLAARRRAFEVVVHAPADLTAAALPGMRASGQGWIVAVSDGGQQAGATVEAATAALHRLVAAVAHETKADGIRVNAVRTATGVRASVDDVVEAALTLCGCGPDFSGRVIDAGGVED